MMNKTLKRFELDNALCLVTGGAGLLGVRHAQAILDGGGKVVLLDINKKKLDGIEATLKKDYSDRVWSMVCDITNEESITSAIAEVTKQAGPIKILINNAANNAAVTKQGGKNFTRLENFPLESWDRDVAVGLTGAFLMAKHVGAHMAEHDGGVVLNIASDLGVIAPDQRIYQKPGLNADEQPVKPVTYSVVKHGLIGLTKYLATYWPDKVRVNSISFGGVYNDQPDEFVQKLTNLIPMGRMANADEYQAAILFLCSDASSYMTGANLIIDGGRTAW